MQTQCCLATRYECTNTKQTSCNSVDSQLQIHFTVVTATGLGCNYAVIAVVYLLISDLARQAPVDTSLLGSAELAPGSNTDPISQPGCPSLLLAAKNTPCLRQHCCLAQLDTVGHSCSLNVTRLSSWRCNIHCCTFPEHIGFWAQGKASRMENISK